MTEYHDRIRKSIEVGEEADYQQDCLNLLAEIAALTEREEDLVRNCAGANAEVDRLNERLEVADKLNDDYEHGRCGGKKCGDGEGRRER